MDARCLLSPPGFPELQVVPGSRSSLPVRSSCVTNNIINSVTNYITNMTLIFSGFLLELQLIIGVKLT